MPNVRAGLVQTVGWETLPAVSAALALRPAAIGHVHMPDSGDSSLRAARMVRTHLPVEGYWGILNAVVLRTTNAAAESMNARIQRMACGYRNRERFRNAILFHLGGLDLDPRAASAHTKA